MPSLDTPWPVLSQIQCTQHLRANQFATDVCHLPFTFALAYRIAMSRMIKIAVTHFIHRFDTHLLLFVQLIYADSHRCSVHMYMYLHVHVHV